MNGHQNKSLLSCFITTHQSNLFFVKNKLKNIEQSSDLSVKRKKGVKMKSLKNSKIIFIALWIILLVSLSFGFNSNSMGLESNPNNNFNNTPKVKAYSFTTEENGEIIYWTAIIRNGIIESLYRNDEKLSDKEIEKYKDMVFKHTSYSDDDSYSFKDFKFPDSTFYFNSEAFKEQMKILKEQMKNFKYDFHFDNENYKEMMDQIRKNMEKLRDEDLFNQEKCEKINKKILESLSKQNFNIHVDVDFDKLNLKLDKLKLKMKNLKIDMSHLSEKMKELKNFLKDVKTELIKDGYLNNNSDDFDLDFTKDKIEVNGKELPDSLLEKCKRIYKDHFGNEINDRIRIMN
jgi:hypothetical protein